MNMINRNNQKQTYLSVISVCAALALAVLIIMIITEYLTMVKLQKQYELSEDEETCRYHCAFITDDPDDVFWNSAYTSAYEQGLRDDIYVEAFGKDLYLSCSTDELITMAMAAHVDAMIVKSTGDESTSQLIGEAIEQGIAVSTIYRDDLGSNRFSFTGINSFQMGYAYGKQALLAIRDAAGRDTGSSAGTGHETSGSILVLLDSHDSQAERRLIVSGIGSALDEQSMNNPLETVIIHGGTSLDVDEQVKELLQHSKDKIDAIICTNVVQTQSVSQLTVDLNSVGNFSIIGTYQNQAILEALAKGVISSSILVDAARMGSEAVRSLAEYLRYGYTSDYVAIESSILTPADAAYLLRRQSETDEGGVADDA